VTACRGLRGANTIESMGVRVGIDLVSVAAVADSVDRHAERYLERIYTERELEDCARSSGIDAQRLAGRFAAKEAVIKVLRPGDEAVPWRTIGVRRDRSGWVDLELSGPAAALARSAGVSDMAVSITHEDGYASAVVVAEVR
jgi:holo-[acyl-carrier protein] synthase